MASPHTPRSRNTSPVRSFCGFLRGKVVTTYTLFDPLSIGKLFVTNLRTNHVVRKTRCLLRFKDEWIAPLSISCMLYTVHCPELVFLTVSGPGHRVRPLRS